MWKPPEDFNLADYLLDARLREGSGERVALRVDGDGGRAWTYREVSALANRFAHVLRDLGVRQEERVLIALPDGAEFVGALFGILKLGGVVVMVNPQLVPANLAALFDYTRGRLVIVHASSLPSFAAALDQSTWKPQLLIAGDLALAPETKIPGAGARAKSPAISGDYPHFEREAQGVGDEFAATPTHRDDAALWLFSGGTTGRPKAVVQSHASFVNTTELYAKAALQYCSSDVTLSVPKLFFGYATGSNLFFPFSVGATAVLFPEPPTAEVLFEKIARHRPTILINVPAMINQMVAHPAAGRQDLSGLRFATSAGEALPAPLYRRWRDTFGVELLDGLGTAEMWHIFLSNLPGRVRPGTLGQAVPGFELSVRDDDGRPLAAGEVGRLWVRGESRAQGYWQNTPLSQEAFRGEWFVGGDLVVCDADGYVTYCGRADDMLKVSGKWVAPQEVESCLMQHPAVVECAVIGVENRDGLTKPVAFVVPKEPAPGLAKTLQEYVLAQLEAYKHPRQVVLLDVLPRTHLGKVDRGKLRTMAATVP